MRRELITIGGIFALSLIIFVLADVFFLSWSFVWDSETGIIILILAISLSSLYRMAKQYRDKKHKINF